MTRRAIYAVIAIFIAWSVLDFVIHGIILGDPYRETASLWRPMGEIKMGLIYVDTLIFATVFVAIYTLFFAQRGPFIGLKYGFLMGIGMGFSMGYGSYAVMPIPFTMAFTWFAGAVIETVVAGLIVGLIMQA
jgi:hypothetical protein